MTTNNNRKTTLDPDSNMIAGVQKHLMSQSFIVGDKPCNAQDVPSHDGPTATVPATPKPTGSGST